MTSLNDIRQSLRNTASEDDVCNLQRFFKTGHGEYGEGDVFIGVRVPAIRKTACQYRNIPMDETIILLKSGIHEERLAALLILVEKYRKGDSDQRKQVYRDYISNTKYVNNWDLVDLSAEHIVGAHLQERSRQPLYKLARSNLLWNRRIAIMSTFYFIKNRDFADTLKLAENLLHDPHDLIHKAVGWMLREIGNRDRKEEEKFLKVHYKQMPRTMLRYAIEKFPESLRQRYLKGRVQTHKDEVLSPASVPSRK